MFGSINVDVCVRIMNDCNVGHRVGKHRDIPVLIPISEVSCGVKIRNVDVRIYQC